MTAPPRDPAFPALHIRPDRGWVNDPNGVCRVDGVYHVFFQYNPHAPHHEAISWGHASSTDLLRWQQQPVALRPRPGALDQGGCWSGCVVDDGGVPTAVYTAVHDTAHNARTALATSDRSLQTWRQRDTAVMSPPDDPAVSDVRDPFVFVLDGRRYAIQGAGHHHGRPQILLYDCDDLTSWTELGPLLTFDDPIAASVAAAQIWECPNLVQVDGQWVLIVSLWQWREEGALLAGVRYLLGDLTPHGSGLTFTPTSGGTLDDGPTCYAPLTLPQPGRVLLWAWAAEHGRAAEDIVAAGWAGVLTFPRELYVRQGVLGSRPAAELVGLRAERLDWSADLAAAAFEIESTGSVQLHLVDGNQTVPVVDAPAGAEEPVRILVDGSLVEQFAGPIPATSRAYPTGSSRWRVTADPAVTTGWRLST